MKAIFLVWVVLFGQVEAGAEADATRAAEVRRLVRQLDATELATRNRAEQQLIDLGPSVLELLPDADEGSAERKQRLTKIRNQLENKAAAESAKGSKVTLKGKMTLGDALAEIEKQTGNKLIDERRIDQSVIEFDTDFDDVPFWEVVDKLLDQANLTVNKYSGSGNKGLAVYERPEQERPRAEMANCVGPLRLSPTRVTTDRSLAVDGDGVLRISLETAWEPRLSPIAFQHPMDNLRAVDDRGEELKPVNPDGQIEVPAPSGSAVEIILPFIAPPRSAERIDTLQGKLIALLPGRNEKFEFVDLEKLTERGNKPATQRKAAATVTLESIRRNGPLWEMRMEIRFDDAGNALESHRNWIYRNPCYLLDKEGKQIENAGSETTLREDNAVGVNYLFDTPDELAGCKFVYESPSSLHVVPIEYEIKDVPLP